MSDPPCPRYIERMVDQRFDPFHEPHGMRKLGVEVERSFVDPARVDVEQPGIARGAKGVDRQAPGFRAHRAEHVAHCGPDGVFLALASMEAGEDEQLQGILRFDCVSRHLRHYRKWNESGRLPQFEVEPLLHVGLTCAQTSGASPRPSADVMRAVHTGSASTRCSISVFTYTTLSNDRPPE